MYYIDNYTDRGTKGGDNYNGYRGKPSNDPLSNESITQNIQNNQII